MFFLIYNILESEMGMKMRLPESEDVCGWEMGCCWFGLVLDSLGAAPVKVRCRTAG